MKTNKGKLSMNEKYTFIDVTDLGEAQNICDNCGAIIRYVVELHTSGGKKFFVGTECSKTLQGAEITNYYSMNENLKAFKKVATAKNLISTGTKIRIAHYGDSCIVVGLNVNKKPVKITIKQMFDPFLGTEIKCLSDFIKSVEPMRDKKFSCLGSPLWYFDYLRTGDTRFINMF